MARNRQLYRIALRGVRRINLSRRLVCWMDEIRMPRTALRIRYVRTCVNQLTRSVQVSCVCQSSKYGVCTHRHSHKILKIEIRVLMKQKVRWHRTKTLGGTGLVTRFYMAGTETLCGGSPAQRCVVSGYPPSSDVMMMTTVTDESIWVTILGGPGYHTNSRNSWNESMELLTRLRGPGNGWRRLHA